MLSEHAENITKAVSLRKLISVLAFVLLSAGALAQNISVAGRLRDRKTKEPVAFANIFVENTQYGTISDISGKFNLKLSGNSQLKIKCLGYRDTVVSVNGNEKNLVIDLQPSVKQLREVVVKPGINPANRIIQLAIDNKKKNDFQQQSSYSYNAYNRGVIELAYDEKAEKKIKSQIFKPKTDTVRDSFEMEAQAIMDSTYLFFMETVSECKYKAPDKMKETILASRTAGTKNPLFSIILSQMQSTSFYTNNVEILTTRYMNPIRKGTFKRYYFEIQDTTFDGNDTIFGIAFNPIPNVKFNALKGKVFINSGGYAIQNIEAEPVLESELLNTLNLTIQAETAALDKNGKSKKDTAEAKKTAQVSVGVNTNPDTNVTRISNDIVFRVKHQYKRDSLNRWHPDLLYFELGLKMSQKSDLLARFVTTNKISDFTFNQKIRRREFSDIAIDVDDDATEQDTSFWNKFRPELNQKEKNTFMVYDTLSEMMKRDSTLKNLSLDKIVDWLMMFKDGKIKWGMFAFDINRLYAYNGYEHSRWGLGVDFNPAKWLTIGGYFGYGMEDKTWKYGGNIDFHFDKYKNYSLSLFFMDDLAAAASTEIQGYNILDIDGNRTYAMDRFSKIRKAGAKISLPLWTYMQGSLSASYSRESDLFDNDGLIFPERGGAILPSTDFAEVRLSLNYEYRKRKIRLPKYELTLNDGISEHPVFNIEYTRGVSIFDADETYNRVLFQYSQNVMFQHYGTFHFFVSAGYVDKDAPYSRMFNATGTRKIHYYFRNSFMTLYCNDFTSNAYANACVSFDFAQTFWNLKHSKPRFFLQLNSLIGTTFGETVSKDGILLNAPEKGILEPCLAVKDLLTYSTLTLGVGCAYRISGYNSVHEWNNIAAFATIGIIF